MRVFVTVGTTCFDELVDMISSAEVLEQLETLGYNEVLMQIGSYKGSPKPSYEIKNFSFFHYKDSIQEDISTADLIISHAGAGSCMEVLKHKKPLIVVVNSELMDDHQIELAAELSRLKHCYMCYCSNLLDTLKSFKASSLKFYEPGNPQEFIYRLNHFMLSPPVTACVPLAVSLLVFLCLSYPLFHYSFLT